MNDFENTVAAALDNMPAEQPADDAQAAEVTAEALMASLLGESETAENTGDGGLTANEEQKEHQQEKDDKFSRRMKAALTNQRRQIYAELGGSEDEIREILREHRAAKLTKENPKISPEAAQIIVEEREKAKPQAHEGPDAATIAAVQSLIDEGWTREELSAFVKDEIAMEQINVDGVSIRRAAMDFFRRYKNAGEAKHEIEAEKRRGVPTFRSVSTAQTQGRNAIEEMSDEEFKRFSKRMEEEALSGRKIRL